MKTLGEFNKELKELGYKATLNGNYIDNGDRPDVILGIKSLQQVGSMYYTVRVNLTNNKITTFDFVNGDLIKKISNFISQFDLNKQLFYVELGKSNIKSTSFRYFNINLFEIKEFHNKDDKKQSHFNLCDMVTLLHKLKSEHEITKYELINKFNEEYVKYV